MFLGTIILTSTLLQAQLKAHHQTFYVNEETITATITAYSSEESPGNNAKGYRPITNFSSACPRRTPLGSRIQLLSDGRKFYCDDRTARRFDDRFDLFVATRREALAWGLHKNEEIIIIYPN